MAEKWWYKQLRMIQYNLQMKDTPRMDPERIASETENMGANAVVINVADSVVWYSTKIHSQKINPYLPKDRDLLKELIDAFHAHRIKVFGRGAFMGFEEETYYQNPGWVKRRPDGSPVMLGNERPGEWYRLYSPCPNSEFAFESGYDVAAEAFLNYDLDGAFWLTGSISGGSCWCDRCKALYRTQFGMEMPDRQELIDPAWDKQLKRRRQMQARDRIMRIKPDMPYLHYYWPFELDLDVGFKIPPDNIDEIAEQCNTLCTEAQDVLSMGSKRLPYWNTPSLRMKMGRTIENYPPPVGIIHACPGMDWRHTCMPEPEFLYWAAQIPANGGSYWTTFTGFGDTIPDKRMMKTVKKLNGMIRCIEDDMDGAVSDTQVLLLSDGGIYVQGWAEALMYAHIDFDMLAEYQVSSERLSRYPLVIVPKGFHYRTEYAAAFHDYVRSGGRLIVEGTDDRELEPVRELLGVHGIMVASEEQEAAYMRIEQEAVLFRERIGECPLLPLRGRMAFCQPREDAQVLLTWVPPFSRAATAGFPPERASLPKEHTDIPGCIVSRFGKGRVMFLPYEPSRMIMEYGLKDMYTIAAAFADFMLEEKKYEIHAPMRVITTAFRKDGENLIHLINGIGQRPLVETIPVSGIEIIIKLAGRKPKKVEAAISGQRLQWSVRQDMLRITLPQLEVWDAVRVLYE